MNKQSFFIDKDSKNSDQSYHSNHSPQNKIDNNTLGSLTKKFVQLIKNALDQTIQIHDASQKLHIKKRRIYDITNVLQGIGYVQKIGKNQMKWVGGQQNDELQKLALILEQKSKKIEQQTKLLDYQINLVRKLILQQTKKNKIYNYLKIQDLQNLKSKDQFNQINNILIYIGNDGDKIQIDSYTQQKIIQCTIQCNTKDSKLLLCSQYQNTVQKIYKNNNTKFNILSKKQKKENYKLYQETIINGHILKQSQSQE